MKALVVIALIALLIGAVVSLAKLIIADLGLALPMIILCIALLGWALE